MRLGAIVLALAAGVIALALLLPGKGTAGRKAPALPAHIIQGAPVTLASLRGRPALVSFFASWCAPCVREAPAFQRAYSQLRGGGVSVVAVDWSDSRAAALKFVKRFGWKMPVLEDSSGLVGDSYGINGLPSTFVLDARGRIVRHLTGPQQTAALVVAARRA